MNRLLPLLALLLVLITACHRTPMGVPGQEQMARLLVDLHVADALADEQRTIFDTDSIRQVLKESVLAAHGMTQEDLDAAYDWYGHNLTDYIKVYERADSIITDTLRAIDLRERVERLAQGGDTADVWPLPPAYVFSRRAASDYLTFEVPHDSTWRRGDVYEFSARLVNSRSPLQVTMAVEYMDDRRTLEVYDGGPVTADGPVSLELRLDSTRTAARIYGFARLTPAEGEEAVLDSITLTRTRAVQERYGSMRRLLRRYTDSTPRSRR